MNGYYNSYLLTSTMFLADERRKRMCRMQIFTDNVDRTVSFLCGVRQRDKQNHITNKEYHSKIN